MSTARNALAAIIGEASADRVIVALHDNGIPGVMLAQDADDLRAEATISRAIAHKLRERQAELMAEIAALQKRVDHPPKA